MGQEAIFESLYTIKLFFFFLILKRRTSKSHSADYLKSVVELVRSTPCQELRAQAPFGG